MPTRAERRRFAREQLRQIASDPNVDRVSGIWTETGQADTGSMAELPEKEPGKHRWMATAAYVLTEEMVRNEQAHQDGNGELLTILDHETRFMFAIGCYDCEQPFPLASPDTVCLAEAGP